MIRERVLGWIGRQAHRHWILVLFLAAVSVAGCILVVRGLPITTRYIDLLPRDHPVVQNYFRVLGKFGGTDYLFVIVESGDPAQTREVVDEMMLALPRRAEFDFIQGRADIDSFRRYGLLYLDLDTLKELDRLLFEGDVNQLARLSTRFMSLQQELSRTAGGGIMVDEEGYFVSEDGHAAFIMARPPFSSDDLEQTVPFARGMSDLARSIEAASPGTRIMLAGNYMFQQEQRDVVNRDILLVGCLALLAIIVILAFAFRSIATPFIAVAALGCGIIWTLALARLVVGSINTISSIFAAVLMGIGIEYGIALLSRYREEREKGAGPEDAFSRSYARMGKAVTTGALTTAVAFFAISFSDFKAMRDMGLVLGMGVVCALLANLLLLPALVTAKEKLQPYRSHAGVREWGVTGHIGKSVAAHPWFYLAAGVLVALGLGISAMFISFETNIRNVEPRGMESVKAEDALSELFGIGPDFVIVLSSSEAAMREVTVQAEQLESVRGVESLATIIPPAQEQKLYIMSRIKQRVLETDPSWLEYVPGDLLAILVDISDTSLAADDIPADLRSKYVSPDGFYATYIYPEKNMYQQENIEEFLGEMEGVSAEVTGFPAIMLDIIESTRKGLSETTLLSAVAVILMVMIDFQRLLPTLLAFLPLLLSLVCMVGAINLLGMKFNLVNIAVTPMILGIGIDFGVYILHRYREEVRPGLEVVSGVLASTGRAIVVSGITVMVSFAALTVARYQGLSNLGIAAVAGIMFALLASLTILPAILTLLQRHRRAGRAF